MHDGGSDVRLYYGPNVELVILVGWCRSFFRLLLGPPGCNWRFSFNIFSCVVCSSQGSSAATQHVVSVESTSLILRGTFRDLFVLP